MTSKTQVPGSSAKKSPRPSSVPSGLDATQQALIAKLESSRESWQTSGRYEAERPQEHPARRRADASLIAGYGGEDDTLDRALADFAESYGDQTERDHGELVKAIKTGAVKAAVVEEAE